VSEDRVLLDPLLGAIISANVDNLARTNNRLHWSLANELVEASATLLAIRDEIERLLRGPYAPSTYAIERAVFLPDCAAVDDARTRVLAQRGDLRVFLGEEVSG